MQTELPPPTDSTTESESKKSEHQASSSPLSATSPDRDHTSLASQSNNDPDDKSTTGAGRFATFWRILDKITYTPKRCRWDPVEPPRFNIWLNLLFGAAGA